MVEVVLLLARLVDGSALCNAVVVAAPDDLGALREAKHALDGFPVVSVSGGTRFCLMCIERPT